MRLGVVGAFLAASLTSGCLVFIPFTIPESRSSTPAPAAEPVGTDPFAVAYNAERAAAGLPPATPDPQLMAFAAAHSADMATHGFVSHTGSDGRDLAARARGLAWTACTMSENVAAGQPSDVAVLRSWIDSPYHRPNLRQAGAVRYGVAQSGDKWTMIIATPCR